MKPPGQLGSGTSVSELTAMLVLALITWLHWTAVAIGGIDTTNCREVFAAGADGIAVIRAIFAASDPAHAAQALLSDSES